MKWSRAKGRKLTESKHGQGVRLRNGEITPIYVDGLSRRAAAALKERPDLVERATPNKNNGAKKNQRARRKTLEPRARRVAKRRTKRARRKAEREQREASGTERTAKGRCAN